MTTHPADVIDTLAGIAPGAHLDTIRNLRKQARDNAQNSYLALFAPEDPGDVPLDDRFIVATFVAALHGDATTAGYYADRLDEPCRQSVATEVALATTKGPYGAYPKGPLSAEDTPGPIYRASPPSRACLGPSRAAALEHAHMLVFHPRDASPEHLQALLAAGWSTTGIVTISQLVAFLAFQIRVVAGLRTLAALPAGAN